VIVDVNEVIEVRRDMAQESEAGCPCDRRTGVVEAAGSFALGRRPVHRVGCGAMQLASAYLGYTRQPDPHALHRPLTLGSA